MPTTKVTNPDIVLSVVRKLPQRSGEKVTRKQLSHIEARAMGGNRGKNWISELVEPLSDPIQDGVLWVYTATLRFQRVSGQDRTREKEIEQILEFAASACKNSQFGQHKWDILQTHLGEEAKEVEKPSEVMSKAIHESSPLKLSIERGHYFDHIFDRDAQIEVTLSALRLANDTEFNERNHVALWGPPGCGKTEISFSIGAMLGEEGVDYIKLDATSTTKAGIEKLLLDAEILPPVLFAEEIEKVEEAGLRYLLGLLDHRAEIRKLNAKIGLRVRQAKMLTIVTVNNLEKFNALLEGALASRFPNKLYCPRPSRAVMRQILLRDTTKYVFSEKYIEPALDYAERWHITDPRSVRNICLCGREALLDGSYQKILDMCRAPEQEESK